MRSRFLARALCVILAWVIGPDLARGAEILPRDSVLAVPGWMSGQPPRWRIGLGPLMGYNFDRDGTTGRFFLDAEGRLAMPQFGLLDAHFEGGVDVDKGGPGTALGMYAKLPYVRVGVERDFDDHRFDLVLSIQGSARRGGMFRRGERLRVDWSPTRKSLHAGFVLNTPWMRYRATRPYRARTDLPRGAAPSPIAADASLVVSDDLARVEHALTWIDRQLTPHLTPQGFYSAKGERAFEREFDDLLEHARQPGHDIAAEDSAYHAGLELAFARAAGGDAARGRTLARAAELVIFEDIVAPVDRMFGHRRRRAGIGGLASGAQARFDRGVLAAFADLDPAHALAVQEVFRRVVLRIEGVAKDAGRRWGGNSLVWLPIQFGLRPEQYDSQSEIEDVIGRVLGEPFTRTNSIRYVLNDQFYYELRNTILQARWYHVLWIHDFRGRNVHKEPDRVAWNQATEGYIEAMTRAVEAMDRGERDELPVFVMFLDEHYYEVNRSRRLISMLERLGTARAPELGDSALETRLAAALSRLQDAVRRSPALAQRGKLYVRQRVRVQIHITYPLDPAYAGDILMRDHRKLAFCDVVESDPSAGSGVFTGEGVGEHYEGSHWEDRSLVVRGPELLRVRDAARRLLLSQGFKDDEIPGCLRPAATAPSGGGAVAGVPADWTAHLLTAFNDTGWGAKPATVLKAILYNLMPHGAYLLAPDSIWTSDFWAGMFIGAALRGCHVYVVAPSSDHAPSNALPTLGLMHEAMALLWAASKRMAPDLARSGGDLRVGLYARDSDVSDQRALVEALLARRDDARTPFPQLRIHPDVLRALDAEADTLQSSYAGPKHPIDLPPLGKPQIHMKAQMFLSAEAMGVVSRSEWGPILARYLSIRRAQTVAPDRDVDVIGPSLLCPDAPCDSTGGDVFTAYRDSLRAVSAGASDRAFCLATLGSHNQDRRSMLLDGEVLVAVSGPEALTTAIDFACLMATATWPETRAELDARFPASTGFMKRLRRWMRNLI